MNKEEQDIVAAIKLTKILKTPQKHLATFGVTRTNYYLITQPSYDELLQQQQEESVIREGTVVSERPLVVTPRYMANLDGFSSDARKYFENLVQTLGPGAPGILYQYRNEPAGLDIVSENVEAISQKILADLKDKGDTQSVVIQGVDHLWDVSLLQFIYQFTANSLKGNISEMGNMGLLNIENSVGLPTAIVREIEDMFQRVRQGDDPSKLKEKLDRLGVFDLYEDRFLSLFIKK